MSFHRTPTITVAVSMLVLMTACKSGGSGNGTADEVDAAVAGKSPSQTSPGKISAPITIRYKILGTAIVGQPVPVEVEIASSITERPIAVSYHISDSASMMFPESQAQRIDVRIAGTDGKAARQVTVVPQREGRLYLTILAEVETEAGTMIKTMAIPISVGRGIETPEANGKLRQDADGETVVSMPAREN